MRENAPFLAGPTDLPSRLSGMPAACAYDMHEQHPSPGPQWPAGLGPPRSRAESPVDVLITPARLFTRVLSSLGSVLLLAALALCLDFRLPTAAAAISSLRPVQLHRPGDLAIRSDNTSASLLEVLEVDPPVLAPTQSACQQTLMVHVFAYSYGDPFVGMQQIFSYESYQKSPLVRKSLLSVCHFCFREN